MAKDQHHSFSDLEVFHYHLTLNYDQKHNCICSCAKSALTLERDQYPGLLANLIEGAVAIHQPVFRYNRL